MNDEFIEYMVKKPLSKKENFKRIMCFVFLALIVSTLPFLRSITVGIAALWLFITIKFIFPATEIEYEYLYCDRVLTVDKILGRKKRKTIGEYAMDKIDLVAPVESSRLSEFNKKVEKTYFYDSGVESENHKPYAIIFGVKEKLVLDLSPEFVKIMQKDGPRKVFNN